MEVITCVPNVPDGKPYDGFRSRFWPVPLEWQGVHGWRIWTYLAPNSGTVKRILNYLSYWVSANLCGCWCRRPNILVATSPQFFCGWAGVFAKWIYRLRDPLNRKPVPFVLEIRDIWPESIGAVKAMRASIAMRFLTWMEHRMYRSASHIVTVGEGYKRLLVERGVPSEKITVIMNGVDWDILAASPSSPQEDLRTRFSSQGKFVCAYVGTVGMACGLEVVLRAAKELQDRKENGIHFWIVGDGAVRKQLQAQSAELGLNNVFFTGRVSKEQIPGILASCECCLVHLRKTPLFETVIPSKIFETWGMKRPLIMAVRGEAQRLVQEAQGGVCIEPDSPSELIDAIRLLNGDAVLAGEMGERGHQYVAEHFDRDQLADRYLRLLKELAFERENTGTSN